MRLPVGALPEAGGLELSDQRENRGRCLCRITRQRRQQSRKSGGEHRFAGAGWPDHQHIVDNFYDLACGFGSFNNCP